MEINLDVVEETLDLELENRDLKSLYNLDMFLNIFRPQYHYILAYVINRLDRGYESSFQILTFFI